MINHNNNGDIMYEKGIWSDYRDKEIKFNSNDKIDKDSYDILIIGGGITGISSAYFLKDSGYKIALIDKGKIGNGITCKSTAKITYLQGTIYQTLNKFFGWEKAYNYYKSQIDAMGLIKNIIKDEKIECDFEKCNSIIFTLKDTGIKKINKEEKILKSFDCKVFEINSKKCSKGIKIKDSYVFNPLKFIDGVIKKLDGKVKIYEEVLANSLIKKDDGYIVKTSKGNISAKRVIMACHYPFFLWPRMFPIKTYIKREYVSAGKINEGKNYSAISIDKDLHSVRFYKDYLIYGSGEHRLTNKINYLKNYEKSKNDFKKYFGIMPKYTWMNQDIMSNDYLPFIGKVRDNLYVSLGYNAWGMTNGVLGGKIIANIILNGKSKYQELFNPNRVNILMMLNSLVGMVHYLKGYAEGLFIKNNPEYIIIDGLLHGIYIDDKGYKHVVRLICPHMKCFLTFNKAEETWDCPCHGSRFDLDGQVITGPASDNILVNKKKDNS